MTVHLPQPSLREAVALVVEIAQQFDEDRIAPKDRANAAVSYVIERQSFSWPLSLQRQILQEAIAALTLGTSEETGGPAQEVARPLAAADPLAITPPVEAPQPVTNPEPIAVTPDTPTPEAAAPDVVKSDAQQPTITTPVLADELAHAPLEPLDFSETTAKPKTEQETFVLSVIETLSTDRRLHLTGGDVIEPVAPVLAETLGLGPLDALLADEGVTYIMVNRPDQIYVERGGKLERTQVRFRDEEHLFIVASQIAATVGQRIDEAQPMVNVRLADGSHVNIAVPPLAIDGPTLTIRKFPLAPITLEKLVEGGSLSAQMSHFLAIAALLRLNILVSGGTGSGKTTLMNAMADFIPESERIVSVEDAAELRWQQEHVVRFETRPANVDGTGEITMRTLVRNALRMRPDRIIIGEIRGDEVLDLLQAMNTGHDGFMSTLHATSPAEALVRIENMAALAGFSPGGGVLRRQLGNAVQLIMQVSRMRDGQRRVTSISELTGLSGDVVTLQELFTFQTDPESTGTMVTGEHVYSGYLPSFTDRAADYGVADELEAILGTK